MPQDCLLGQFEHAHRPTERVEFFLSAQGVTTNTMRDVLTRNRIHTRITKEKYIKHKPLAITSIRLKYTTHLHFSFLFPFTTPKYHYICSFTLYTLGYTLTGYLYLSLDMVGLSYALTSRYRAAHGRTCKIWS